MMEGIVTTADKRLMEAIKKNPKAYEKLKAKAQWEHMSLFKVLREYGDPRKWKP